MRTIALARRRSSGLAGYAFRREAAGIRYLVESESAEDMLCSVFIPHTGSSSEGSPCSHAPDRRGRYLNELS